MSSRELLEIIDLYAPLFIFIDNIALRLHVPLYSTSLLKNFYYCYQKIFGNKTYNETKSNSSRVRCLCKSMSLTHIHYSYSSFHSSLVSASTTTWNLVTFPILCNLKCTCTGVEATVCSTLPTRTLTTFGTESKTAGLLIPCADMNLAPKDLGKTSKNQRKCCSSSREMHQRALDNRLMDGEAFDMVFQWQLFLYLI